MKQVNMQGNSNLRRKVTNSSDMRNVYQRRNEAVFSGGAMRAVIQAVLDHDEPIEIHTNTHIITITAVIK